MWESERRRATRVVLKATVQLIRVTDGLATTEVELLDFSGVGCRIRGKLHPLQMRDRVTLVLDLGNGTSSIIVRGRVVWQAPGIRAKSGWMAGISFVNIAKEDLYLISRICGDALIERFESDTEPHPIC